MYSCTVSFDDWRVSYESTCDLASAFRRLAEQPPFTDLRIDGGISDSSFLIRYHESDQTSVRYYRRHVEIHASWTKTRGGEMLLYAALPFVALQRQRFGYVTAHAAAVAFPKGAILLLGKGGAGKTIAALALCRWHDARLIGNDLVVFGINKEKNQMTTRGGTKFFHLRYESIRRNIPELLHLFPPSEEDLWLRKVMVNAADVGISTEDKPVQILCAYLVHVDETQGSFFTKLADSVVTRLYLNENFSRYIRGGSIALLDQDLSFLGFVPSFDSAALFRHRTTLIEKLLKEPPMLYVSGKLSEVASFIASYANGDSG